MADRQEARDMVMSITKRWGYLSDSVLDQLDAAGRRELEQNWAILESVAGHSIQTLAKHIYGSGARFVFELLQNADDNSFNLCEEEGDVPSVKFKVHPDRIVVECNEDGFSERDLRSICDVGKSTKAASYGYIGAKGIGFKSVFIAAWKVYIESRYLSFYFRHEKGDSGLGMIRPIWKDPEVDVVVPFTRMTLYIHKSGDPEDLDHLKKTIFRQFEDLKESCLLFLKKIKKIEVSFYDEKGGLKDFKHFKAEQVDDYRVCLETSSRTEGLEGKKTRQYHVTKYTATNLAKSDNRDLPDTEEARKVSSTAEVVLAFPLTGEMEPLLENQDIFAFLPVRESGYKFLIQSDFDTTANRQDIVTTSKRNLTLLDGIASAFIKAVSQFFEAEKLCYQWPQFLPESGNSFDSFWSGLNERIEDEIFFSPVLKSRHRYGPRLVTEVFDLSVLSADEYGDCLYDDTADDLYISKKYKPEDIKILSSYGLRIGSPDRTLMLLRKDLDSPNSRMKDFTRRSTWHSKAAASLTEWYDGGKSNNYVSGIIQKLPLIPLQNGQWVSAASGPVYLPSMNNVPLPLDLGFRILDPRALDNPDRRTLFKCLGVTEASAGQVRDTIRKFYQFGQIPLTIERSISHLHHLYLTHDFDESLSNIVKDLVVFDTAGNLVNPRHIYIFMATDHPFGPKKLLEPTETAPGYSDCYLYPSYLARPPKDEFTHLSWENWLYDIVDIDQCIPLAFISPELKLSEFFIYIANHRPEKFLGTLEYLWKQQAPIIKSCENIKKQIKALFSSTLCENGSTSNHRLIHNKTWLPLPHLKAQVAKYIHGEGWFPFLSIDDFQVNSVEGKWAFLHQEFDVGGEDDIDFYLNIIDCMSSLKVSRDFVHRAFELYEILEAKITIAENKEEESAKIRDMIFMYGHILRPDPEYTSTGFYGWKDGESRFRWEGPPDMDFLIALKPGYTEATTAEQMQKLSLFFRKTMGIKDTSWNDIVEELESIRDTIECSRGSLTADFDQIQGLYKYVAHIKAPKKDLQDAFKEDRLIYLSKNGTEGWYKSSDCLWSSTSEIRGKVAINDDYGDLKAFFTNTLGVQSLTLQMMYDELRLSNDQKSVDDIKNGIWSFNALLQTNEKHPDPAPLLNANIIPVRYPGGGTALRNIKTIFAVGDSRQLTARLRDQITLLDFGFEEIRRLKPFMEWAKLDERYLSRSVREFTRVSPEATKRPIRQEKYTLTAKAHAILRIASTFQSPKYSKSDPESLYRVLREAEVFQTDGISSVISISQDGNHIELEEVPGQEHIDDSDRKLKVYVPLKKNQLHFCFSSVLPAKLAGWLMQDWDSNIPTKVDKDAVHILSMVLLSDLAVVGQILDHGNVFEVEVINQDPEYDEETEDIFDESDEEASIRHGVTPLGDTTSPPTAHFRGLSESRHMSDDDETIVVETVEALGRERRHAPHVGVWNNNEPSPRRMVPVQDPTYLRLLNRVIAASRQASFPSLGAFDMTGLFNGLPNVTNAYESFDGLDVATRFRSATQLERDKMVGAAGELYVFELCSTLGLSTWSRANWQSTIRKYVTIHPDYRDMEPWYQRETADIVYQDLQGELTSVLIGAGYLHDDWRNARPKYLIEVKTSTGPLATPFYMSKNQYRLMQTIHGGQDRSQVYMIFRVFWLDDRRIGMKVYLDPEQMRHDGGLVFTGESWSIVPGNNNGNQ